MVSELITTIGLLAGALTSIGFIPQIIKGIRTKKLEDVSYLMPIILTIGMILWLIYGLLITDLPLITANIVGVASTILLIILKRHYRKKIE